MEFFYLQVGFHGTVFLEDVPLRYFSARKRMTFRKRLKRIVFLELFYSEIGFHGTDFLEDVLSIISQLENILYSVSPFIFHGNEFQLSPPSCHAHANKQKDHFLVF